MSCPCKREVPVTQPPPAEEVKTVREVEQPRVETPNVNKLGPGFRYVYDRARIFVEGVE